jgi:hypothetical protein
MEPLMVFRIAAPRVGLLQRESYPTVLGALGLQIDFEPTSKTQLATKSEHSLKSQVIHLGISMIWLTAHLANFDMPLRARL